ncbi:MAG: M42 family metallopeptidase [Ndongobacter sp.]|nr:M42 family metallopeptidase [Ndongobacter sp.]
MSASWREVVEKTLEWMAVPSVGSDTARLREMIWDDLGRMGIERTRTRKGLIYATIRGRDDTRHRLVTAHIDTLGAMVKDIRDNGRLRLTQIGGYAWGSVEGENVTVFATGGKEVTGTLLPDKASVHVFSDEAREMLRTEDSVEVRLDADVRCRQDTLDLGIRVGDVVAFDTRTRFLEDSGYLKSRYLDDKVCVGIMYSAMKELVESGEEIPFTTHFMFSDYEEIGHGAYGWPQECAEFLAVDIGPVGPGHTSDEKKVTIVAKDSRTPYSVPFRRRLERLAEEHHIDYATDVHFRYGSDACAAMQQGFDMDFACIGLGVDATHHYERTHVDGIQNNLDLLLAYVRSN